MRDFFWDKVSSLVSSGSLYNFHDNLHSNLGILYVGEKFYRSLLPKLNVYSGITEIIRTLRPAFTSTSLFFCPLVRQKSSRKVIYNMCLTPPMLGSVWNKPRWFFQSWSSEGRFSTSTVGHNFKLGAQNTFREGRQRKVHARWKSLILFYPSFRIVRLVEAV